jgi:hypothetical protein
MLIFFAVDLVLESSLIVIEFYVWIEKKRKKLVWNGIYYLSPLAIYDYTHLTLKSTEKEYSQIFSNTGSKSPFFQVIF